MFLARIFAIAAVLLAASSFTAARAQSIDDLDAYRGLYRASADRIVGIDAFIADDGSATLLYADYQSGVVRRLFRVSDAEFVMGPDFAVQAPVELAVTFQRDGRGRIASVALLPADGAETAAPRIPLKREAVSFRNGHTRLAGTLILPDGNGPHPAITLLHGSGPLTRNSFGPYPLFFASLGFAVLTFDKRGTGESTGVRLDAGTGRLMAEGQYPDALLGDAQAALRLLEGRAEIDSRKIGFWGSSEGGMLTLQIAARSPDVAFAINSSGFTGPLWQTALYQAGAYPRLAGRSDAEIEDSVAFTKQWLDVARTGEGWDAFAAKREEIRRTQPNALFWSSGEFESVDEMRWYWDHVLSFDPLPALENVQVPVLGVFGGADPATEAPVAAANLTRAVTGGGNADVTTAIFPDAGHSLSAPTGGRMAPGVFDTLRSWLLARVEVSDVGGSR